ncbi:hypothetical protein CFN78_08845 [Amycolatopsis antarctica]|uniref:Uncharacterized protein n=1 Tax=Amycolatopsis antarctica TaxID=1854586 RepID=A0A263D547_9PSEU|nr:hypothetical protein [Amycolatopsis antarctica]OZM73624.1 hypothetical protein CFN78_08845 [Amycolatopsis antarctica]
MTWTSGEHPRARLGHYAGEWREGQTRIAGFDVQDIPVPRPASGITTGSVFCRQCGEEITVSVAASAIAQRWRRRWTSATFLALLALAAMLAVDIAFIASGRDPELDFFLLCMATALIGAAALLCRRRWRFEDGVRSPQAPVLPWVQRKHRLLNQ